MSFVLGFLGRSSNVQSEGDDLINAAGMATACTLEDDCQ